MPATLGLQASARLVDPAEGLALDFALLRQDAPGEVKGRARYAPDDGKDTLDPRRHRLGAGRRTGGAARRRSRACPPCRSRSRAARRWTTGTAVWRSTPAVPAGSTAPAPSAAVDGGRRVMLDLGGAVAGLVPADIRPLFADKTTMIGSAVVGDEQHRDRGAQPLRRRLRPGARRQARYGAKTADLASDLVGGDPSHFASPSLPASAGQAGG